jgi:integrase/recombinase XerD
MKPRPCSPGRVDQLGSGRHRLRPGHPVRAPGKGGRDRHVPVGERARHWVLRYRDESRPHFATMPDPGTLFLTIYGKRFAPDMLSRAVTAYIRAGAPHKHGSCHLFRHSAATLITSIDAGADVRYIAEMLGH